MFSRLFKNLLGNIFLLFILFSLTFVMITSIGGDPALIRAGERADEATLKKIRQEFGLDLPLPERFFKEATKVFLKADPGVSLRTRRPVQEDLLVALPATIELGFSALVIATLLGVPLGIISAKFRGRFLDLALTQLALLGISIPVFVLGYLMILAFSDHAYLSFDGRLSSEYLDQVKGHFYFWGHVFSGEWEISRNALGHLVLPSLTLATIPMALIMRLTRSAFLEQLNEDWLKTARAKGLGEFRVLCHHALRVASPAIVTVIGLQVGLLMSGAVLTESIFSWPGMGKYLIESLRSQDYPALQGTILLFGAVYIATHLLVDVVCALLDPRLRKAA